jgi:hypothetical protein
MSARLRPEKTDDPVRHCPMLAMDSPVSTSPGARPAKIICFDRKEQRVPETGIGGRISTEMMSEVRIVQ